MPADHRGKVQLACRGPLIAYSSTSMLNDATRQIRARLHFMAQERVLMQRLAALRAELAHVRDQRLSAAEWEAAEPCVRELSAAAARCRDRLRGAHQVDSDAARS